MTDSQLPLAWRNRQLLAERQHWPDGALPACERMERAFPDWSISWRHESTIVGFERPAGYYAERDGSHEVQVSAGDPDELVRLMEDAPPGEHSYTVEGCPVCLDRMEERLRRAGF